MSAGFRSPLTKSGAAWEPSSCMNITLPHRRRLALLALALCSGTGLGALHGCEPGESATAVARQCGLDVECEAGGFAEGKASISGVASIDAFFGAAIDLNAAMLRLDGKLRGELDAVGASVGLEPGASGADLKLAIEDHLSGYIEGGLKIDYQAPKCEASVEAGISAAAECDAEVEPGSVTAKCEGSCEIEAGAEVKCDANATLVCKGTAPEFECSGDAICSGSCVAEFSAAARCDGTCRGSCTVDGQTMDGFDGQCNGDCEGECAVDMSAGGSCEFECQGSCEYKPASGTCEADASARCEANAGASIECDAGCEGTVEPPMVSAECEATVDAKASASVECTPPTLAFGFGWNAAVANDLEAQAEFRAWLEGFRLHFAAILAARVEAELVAKAGLDLVATTEGALKTAIEDLIADPNVKASFGARCAILELPVAAAALQSSQGELTASASAAVEVVSAF